MTLSFSGDRRSVTFGDRRSSGAERSLPLKQRKALPKFSGRSSAAADGASAAHARQRAARHCRRHRRQRGRGFGEHRHCAGRAAVVQALGAVRLPAAGAGFAAAVRAARGLAWRGVAHVVARGMGESPKPARAAWRRAGARFTPGRALLLGQMAPLACRAFEVRRDASNPCADALVRADRSTCGAACRQASACRCPCRRG